MRTLGAISDCESSDSDSETAYKLSDDEAERDEREAMQWDTSSSVAEGEYIYKILQLG